jgi:hypothetical protein
VAEESEQREKPVQQREPPLLLAQEQKLSPQPSLWPVLLALTLVIVCVGVIAHPILLGVGAVLTVIAVIGWMREKH